MSVVDRIHHHLGCRVQTEQSTYSKTSKLPQISRRPDSRFAKEKYLKAKSPLNNSRLMVQSLNTQIERPSIEKLMLTIGFEFQEKMSKLSYLPLEYFEDTQLQKLSDEQLIDILQSTSLTIQVMEQGNLGQWFWYPAKLVGYSKLFKYRRSNKDGRCNRIHFILDSEDPGLYIRKLQCAFELRDQMDKVLRYNYYIDNMPTDDLLKYSKEQQHRMQQKVKGYSRLQQVIQLRDALQVFYRTQNQLMFNQYLINGEDTLAQKDLIILLQNTKVVPQFGLLQLCKDRFQLIYTGGKLIQRIPSSFKQMQEAFQFASLLTYKPVIRCIGRLNLLIQQLFEWDLFQYTLIGYDQFKYVQESNLKNTISLIKSIWIKDLVDTIQKELKISQKKSPILHNLQLDRFFQLIRTQVQEGLLGFMRKNCRKLVNYLKAHNPASIKVHSLQEVQNIFVLSKQVSYDNFDEQRFYDASKEQFPQSQNPVFQIKLLATTDDIQYSHNPRNMTLIMNQLLDRIVNEISAIPDPEPTLLDNYYKFDSIGFLKTPNKDEECFIRVNIEFDKLQLHYRIALEEYLYMFEELKRQMPIEQLLIEENQRSIERVRELINANKSVIQSLDTLPQQVQVGLFLVNLEELTQQLAYVFNHKEYCYLDAVAKFYRNLNSQLIQEFQKIELSIKELPTDIEKLVAKRDYITNMLPVSCEQKYMQAEMCKYSYDLLEEMYYSLRRDDIHNHLKLRGMRRHIDKLVRSQLDLIEQQTAELLTQQKQQQQQFQIELKEMDYQILKFKQLHTTEQLNEALIEMQYIEDSLQRHRQQANLFNKREDLFGLETTQYVSLLKMQKEFQPYKEMWETLNIWNKNKDKWLNDNFKDVDSVGCEQFVNDQYRVLISAIVQFKERKSIHILEIAEELKREIDEFKPNVPILIALTKQAMKQRHFNELSDVIKKDLIPNEITLQQLINTGMLKHTEFCVELGYRAQQQYNIESLLQQIEKVWSTLQFQSVAHKTAMIFKKIEEIQIIVDDHLIQLQSMILSKYNTPFANQINTWYNNIKCISNFIEEWVKLQQNWMYFFPIFESFDISKQLPVEFKKFRAIDKQYKQIVSYTTLVHKFALQDITRISDCNQGLEQIHKELGNYLERKRENFNRLYFLSNDDLLEILSQVQEPKAMQPFLKKIFESITQLNFKGQFVSGICAEEETMDLANYFNPHGKNIEEWLQMLEKSMKESVQKCLLDTILDSSKYNISQCVLTSFLINFTSRVEAQPDNLDPLLSELNDKISDLVKQIQNNQYNMMINSMIILLVHAKDIIGSLNNYDDFEWSKQIRYYLVDKQCHIRCLDSSIEYGYEYLGSTQRLVITPLTDRCYMTMLNALSMGKSGAAIGPTGTGKTETIKDLAKSIGKHCVVFNCSPLIDHIMITRFFKGLAGSGSWCCLDEFNRINIEVLSVIASQLQHLYATRIMDPNSVKDFGFFVTMNPSYAGRSELPDNLKRMFRTVAMTDPNSRLIVEIMLYSYGFLNGYLLATQVMAMFNLSKQLLSTQIQYDYSLRAIKGAINAAYLYKQQHWNATEAQIVLTSIKDTLVPRLVSSDVVLFKNLIRDVFPHIFSLEQTTIKLQGCVESAKLREKVSELYNTQKVRHGIMVLGPEGGGKSTCIRITAQHLQCALRFLYPMAVHAEELFGSFNLTSLEWQDGILPNLLRSIDQQPTWVVFDGPVHTKWIESLNTVLDDSHRLCLTSGQIMQIPDTIKFLFEIDSLQDATPATISRCGIIYINDQENNALAKYCEKYSLTYAQQVYNAFKQAANQVDLPNQQLMLQFIQLLDLLYIEENDLLIFYCLAWAIMPQLDIKQRSAFDHYLKTTYQIPLVDQLINYQLVDRNLRVYECLTNLPPNLPYHEIIVPTRQNVAYLDIASRLLAKRCNVRLTGQTGAGKTSTAYQLLTGSQFIRINYSGQVTSSATQCIMETKLEKRRKGVYGPGVGQQCIVLLDDLQMAPETELLRQFIATSGWYSKRDQQFLQVEETTLLAAMSAQQGLSGRFLRHFTNLRICVEESTFDKIFNTLAHYFQLGPAIYIRTMRAFRELKAKLLPSPLKVHYQFNMRDVWRVMQSLCTHRTLMEQQWTFEMSRVFVDKLTTKSDKLLAYEIIGAETVFFCDFVNGPQAERSYKAVKDFEALALHMKDLFQMHRMPYYDEALLKLIAIQRVISLRSGHCILLGTLGSGHFTLAKMAASINGYFTPIFERWRDDLRQCLKNCIVENRPLCIIVQDHKSESGVLDDLSTLMNSGDLDLFTANEIDELHRVCQIECTLKEIPITNINIHQEFVNRIKRNLHIVVCLSQQSGKFREYPSFVNSATIICFQQLPEQALQRMAIEFLHTMEDTVEYLPDLFRFFHHSVMIVSNIQMQEECRQTHFTSLTYSEMLETFRRIHDTKQQQLQRYCRKIQNGLSKVWNANEAIQELQGALKIMTPQIELASKETQAMMVVMSYEKESADQQEAQLSVDEQQAAIQQQEALLLAQQAEQAVEQVNQILEQTLQEVQKLRKDHLVEIKSLGKPPKPVIVILSGVVILNLDNLRQRGGEIVQRVFDVIKKEDDYFETAKRYFLNDPKELLELLRTYDKNNINPYHINRLEKLVISDPEFTYERARQCSAAVKYLFSWVKAMYDYNKVFIETKPLRERMQQQQKVLQLKTQILEEKKMELQDIQMKVKDLHDKLQDKLALKRKLSAQVAESELKLHRAQQLTKGLSAESQRWSEEVQQTKKKLESMQGDCAISAAFVSYCGPLTMRFRKQLLQQWVKQTNGRIKYAIPPIGFLGDPNVIQRWLLNGLPNDDTSIENALIMTWTAKYSLCIDPQGQANRFLRQYPNIQIVSGLDQKQIDLAFQLGQLILIENINKLPNIRTRKDTKVYITTMLANPSISVEQFRKYCVINFTITEQGLQEQLLNLIVKLENPTLQRMKQELMTKKSDNADQLESIEDSILQILDVDNILDLLNEETLINQLNTSKQIGYEILRSQIESAITQESIEESRQQYKQLAVNISYLFFRMQELQYLDYTYQFSLDWFQTVFSNSLKDAVITIDVAQRANNILCKFRIDFYRMVSRSLFEQHQFLFAFMLTQKQIDSSEWKAFITNARISITDLIPLDWLDQHTHQRIVGELGALQIVSVNQILNDLNTIRPLYESSTYDQSLIPARDSLTQVQQLYVVKAIRPDYVRQCMQMLIDEELIATPIQLEDCYEDSEHNKILMFILQKGFDPMEMFKTFAKSRNFHKKWVALSLGQGQGLKAEKLIREAANEGFWVLLQNCHLAPTWMNDLDKLSQIESHSDFRLWLTTLPTDALPARLLQKSVKISIGQSKELRNDILMRDYSNENEKTLLFKLCCFHMGLVDRLRVGTLGFNEIYDFTLDDFDISWQQIRTQTQWKAMQFICSQLHYGGKVIDELDLRVLIALGDTIFRDDQVVQNNVGVGLHDNAIVRIGCNDANSILHSLQQIHQKQVDRGITNENTLIVIVNKLTDRLPKQFNIDDISTTYPILYEESMNALLLQEIRGMNQLINIISITLQSITLIINGDDTLCEDLIIEQLINNIVPQIWIQSGFLSVYPLGMWFENLIDRYTFIEEWCQQGIPKVFQINLIMFPQSFFACAKQNYCRSKLMEYQDAHQQFIVMDSIEVEHITSRADNGYYINGIYIEGAQWSKQFHSLEDSQIMMNKLPILLLHFEQDDNEVYQCPLYKTISRTGDSNLVTFIKIPTINNVWTLRGVAAFLQH